MRTLSFLLSISCLTLPLIAQPPKKQLNNQNWLKDQNDQTDTYAIPADDSEAEEQAEMDALEEEQKKKSKKKTP